MPYSALTISRSDIDGYESITFADYTGGDTLSIGDTNDNTLNKAKKELKADILDKTGELWRDDEYDTETALLDALYDADDEDLLKDLLAYKFLSMWFFNDAQNEESLSYSKARSYHHKYVRYLDINISRILGDLSDPKSAPRFKMNHGYA